MISRWLFRALNLHWAPGNNGASRCSIKAQDIPPAKAVLQHRCSADGGEKRWVSMGFPWENYRKMLTWPNKNGDLVGFHGTNHGITNDFMGENDGGSTIFLASPRNPRWISLYVLQICAWLVLDADRLTANDELCINLPFPVMAGLCYLVLLWTMAGLFGHSKPP